MGCDLGIADVLDRAADLIEPEGRWTQNAWWRDAAGRGTGKNHPSGIGKPFSRCMACALSQAKKRDISREIKATGFATLNAMVSWNDACGRTQSEVVAKLRESAALARGNA